MQFRSFTKIPTFDNDVVLLGKDELDVAGRGHVGVNTTVSTVSTAPHLSRAIHCKINEEWLSVSHFKILVTQPLEKLLIGSSHSFHYQFFAVHFTGWFHLFFSGIYCRFQSISNADND